MKVDIQKLISLLERDVTREIAAGYRTLESEGLSKYRLHQARIRGIQQAIATLTMVQTGTITWRDDA